MLTALYRRLRTFLRERFPERHIYIRTDGEMSGIVLSPARQMAFAGVIGAVGVWTGLSVVAMLMAMAADPNGIHAQHARAYERLVADSGKQLAREGVPVMANADTYEALALTVEKRHDALVKLFASVTCPAGGTTALAAPVKIPARDSAPNRLKAVQADQDRLIGLVDTAAKPCADRAREAIRVAGLNPETYAPSPPVVAATTIAHADSFVNRIGRAFAALTASHVLADAVAALPLDRPTNTTEESSGFGFRVDPITGQNSNHPGLDFPAPRMTAVFATAPGVVSFSGLKSGYGNTVEIDHGRGVTTRFAHLAAYLVKVGDRVTDHQQIGGVGSTGHSTGPHLHYEILVDGRPQNPEHFLKAGDYVHQAG